MIGQQVLFVQPHAPPHRHRPYAHGRHHAPFATSGTGSVPHVPQGWQRQSLAVPIQPPAQTPCLRMASIMYWEQEGAWRQRTPSDCSTGLMAIW